MGSKVISFRFNDEEVEALQAIQSPEDEGSLNQTAARLVRSFLPLSTSSTSVDTRLETVENALAELRSHFEAQLEELRGKSKAR
ncbi:MULTISPECIES: hypothetical protein [unclassified Tolypothrix]|uniref:hypothetical protein n=1 Tax=unclassified Tolypothrix TaxID=2649714 RepID=UPI0005EABCC5|nr:MULTISPECIES: hypothetical protein [unclassified Tolypothrix]BAY90788.1 hypothetical protein NIES3275_28050 [Microchaete diplosiphon NIES-3275]EKF04365.1 hypothetical protein FDUTEX481_02044 [Tolypothrix sp. PCC 7601]MBE9081012.1 hypothetical protein [Tolypothrix sp. LEGE 11397]UYD24921.1 hypothetical protein HGR01_26420 [Tolypothrix sp. PCC 7712]UYD32846.1 hypothetical protein HG267_28215 [Tolypothrix sp. PCC 7601]